jgi:LETM1 and EF-hand domain-containing protein 1, mitochondrial
LGTHQSAPTAIDKTQAFQNATLTELAAEKTKDEEKALASKKEEPQKLTIGQKIMKELHHYWDGTKLLATEVKISTRLALKMAAGYDLSRRENRQVCLDEDALDC